jgi:hypothetical protein
LQAIILFVATDDIFNCLFIVCYWSPI